MTTDPQGHFLFVAGSAPTVWVIDTRPGSPTFNTVLLTINLPQAANYHLRHRRDRRRQAIFWSARAMM